MANKLLLQVISILIASAAAQVSCTGTLTTPNPITSDVNVPAGASCTLQTSVTGSISIGDGASFATTGTVQIDGGVGGTGVNTVNLGGTGAINGGMEIDGATSVSIGTGINAGSVSVTDGPVTLSGTVTGLSSSGTGAVSVTGGTVLGGGLSKSGSGDVTVCGGNLVGGINFVEATSSLSAVSGPGCAASDISGTIEIEKGTGDLNIAGAMLMAADVKIVEQTGDVSLADAVVSDISVSGLTGSLTLSAAADSDTTLEGVTGPIVVTNFEGLGDFGISSAGSTISITNSKFGNETVGISGAVAAITMTGNTELSILLENNPTVTFNDNTVMSGEFKGNTNLDLNDNSFATLVCADNGSVTGGGNTAGFNDGQCSAVVV